MLKGNNVDIDLQQQAQLLLPEVKQRLAEITAEFGEDAIEYLDNDIVDIHYPVDHFPTKIASHNFDKEPVVSGILEGIKGQYLLFDNGVINIRKFSSYEIIVAE